MGLLVNTLNILLPNYLFYLLKPGQVTRILLGLMSGPSYRISSVGSFSEPPFPVFKSVFTKRASLTLIWVRSCHPGGIRTGTLPSCALNGNQMGDCIFKHRLMSQFYKSPDPPLPPTPPPLLPLPFSRRWAIGKDFLFLNKLSGP